MMDLREMAVQWMLETEERRNLPVSDIDSLVQLLEDVYNLRIEGRLISALPNLSDLPEENPLGSPPQGPYDIMHAFDQDPYSYEEGELRCVCGKSLDDPIHGVIRNG